MLFNEDLLHGIDTVLHNKRQEKINRGWRPHDSHLIHWSINVTIRRELTTMLQ